MAAARAILVLGGPGDGLAQLAERVRGLGFRTLRAKTPQDALLAADESHHALGAALVDCELPAVDLTAALQEIRLRFGAPDLRFVAAGERPGEATRAALREAGVELALWLPVDDAALRFQLNGAMAARSPRRPRSQLRVPAGWEARIYSGGRVKPATVYSVSGSGAFLATGRPSLRGAEVAVELELPDDAVSVGGRVVYTNVPGNLMRQNLPAGMAVHFSHEGPQERARIAQAVEARARELRV